MASWFWCPVPPAVKADLDDATVTVTIAIYRSQADRLADPDFPHGSVRRAVMSFAPTTPIAEILEACRQECAKVQRAEANAVAADALIAQANGYAGRTEIIP